MPAARPPRQAEAFRTWLADPEARALLFAAQAAWPESKAQTMGGQVCLRLLPTLDWAVAEPGGRFAAIWTLAADGPCWRGPWRAAADSLPLAPASVSRIDLRFVLEGATAPERLIAECARVLRPEGRLLVFGLNPWGLARFRWGRQGVEAMPRSRVVGWLRSEGLEVLAQQSLGPRWRPAPFDPSLRRPGLGAGRVAWAVLAARRDHGLTPWRGVRVAWRGASGVPAS